jgi:hypothetical protein
VRKLWNENTVEIQGTRPLNPILDLQVGKASGSDASYTMSTLEH